MAYMENARAGDAGASKAGWLYEAHNTPKFRTSQQAGRACALLTALGDGARSGKLGLADAEFIASIQHQAKQRRWRPSPRQCAVIQRIGADLAESAAPLIDDDDRVEPRAETGGGPRNSLA